MKGLRDYAGLLDKLGRGEAAAALHSRADTIRQRREQGWACTGDRAASVPPKG
jgi:hypothetical protein